MIVTRLSRRWDVPDEFWLFWWRNREHRQLIIDVPVEPASKGPAGKAMAPEFQRQVMDRMEQFGRYPMTGPVALELHFRAARRNPPVIYRTVKYTLDLLGAAVPGSERPRRRNVLYRDDRQVKFLYAELDQQWQRKGDDSTSTGGLWMVARRASDVAADLSMAARLHESHLDENDEESPFWVPAISEDPDLGWPLEPASGRTPVEQYLADVTRFHHVADVQEAMLTGTDATLIWALGSYLDDRSGGGPAELASILAESRAAIRNLLLLEPLTLPLPSLPQVPGQSAAFTRMIRASLEEFRERVPLFQSLLVPVTLTFLVVPPEQGKDLDNIALTVLPIAHDVLRPHIAPHLLSPTFGDEEQRPERAEALARLKSVNALSVRAYQVIELPRSPQDPPEGTLHLALGPHVHESWWRRASAYLGKAIDLADEGHQLADFTWKSIFTG